MLRVLLLAFVLVLSPPLSAQNVREVRSQVESSLRITGALVIGTDGTVLEHHIDPTSALTPELTTFLDHTIDGWRFEPVVVNDQIVRARVPMYLRLVAKPDGSGKYSVRIASTWFGSGTNGTQSLGSVPRAARMVPPIFPISAMRMGAQGTAYVVATFGPDGKARQVFAQQVNLRVVGSEGQMKRMRALLAEASVRAIRTWDFAPPMSGEDAGKDQWSVMIPVSFMLDQSSPPKPGQWDTYVPGPIMGPSGEVLPQTANRPDALPDSGVFYADQGAKLLTPPAS